MKVKDLVQQLLNVDQELEVFVESTSNKEVKTKGVYLISTKVEVEDLPRNCVVVES